MNVMTIFLKADEEALTGFSCVQIRGMKTLSREDTVESDLEAFELFLKINFEVIYLVYVQGKYFLTGSGQYFTSISSSSRGSS